MIEIYNQVNDLVYMLLNRVRNIILSNIGKYIGFYNLNNDTKQYKLKKLLENIEQVRINDMSGDNKYKNVTFIGIEYDNYKYYSRDITNIS